ncbi:DUF1194 domain-containing protein [Photobacterium makurazakiensis]|uniref:DUF1194 domain-containing protein n=1 Tax=Photobacterium makurazakiensis TaxID=2910234 RepID=UPI003D0CA87F
MLKLKVAVLAASLTFAAQSQADVLELALVLDGSGSISTSDYELQLQGYRDIIASGSFWSDYVENSIYDSVHLATWQFSGTVVSEIGWTEITSNAVADTFGNQFNTTDMAQLNSSTNTSLAIDTVVASLIGNGIGGTGSDNMIIDISTDGNPNTGGGSAGAIAAADNARAADVTINAIGVGSGIGSTFLEGLVGIDPIATPQGFFLTASNFSEFGSTLETKLDQEVRGGGPQAEVPEPASLALLSIGLLGLRFRQNKKQA